MGAAFACLPIYRVLMTHTPGHVVLVVGAALVSQVGLLLTLWLPWKLVVMLSGTDAPTLLPQAVSALPQKTQVLLIGGAIAAAYVLHLAAEKLIDWLCERGARQQWRASEKTGLFNNQSKTARQAYQRLLRSMASLVFACLAMAALAVLYPALLLVSLLWCALVPLALHASIRWRPGLAHDLRSSLNRLMSGFVQGGFFCALAYVVWQYWRDALPPLQAVLVALILLRQTLQQIAHVVLHASALDRQRSQVQALFLPGVQWQAPAAVRSPFDELLEPERREQWMFEVLRTQFGLPLDGTRLDVQTRTMAAGHIKALFVKVLDAGGTLKQGFLLKLFDHARDAAAQQETDLLDLGASGLPTFEWLGSARVSGYACHVMHWNPQAHRTNGVEYARGISALRIQLMAFELPPGLVERYRRSRALLPERLLQVRFDALAEAVADKSQADDIETLRLAWPALLQTVRAMPLQLVLPELSSNAVYREEDGSFRIHHWAGWRLEPLGAGWPLSQRIGMDLDHALTQASAVRALPPGVTARQAELAARLHEFERRHARQNYQGAANMAAGLLR
ncbi:hypothetical protein ABIC94_002405 [Variovorax paradoxus]|uniref:hypothetical protein n=1 Tax=Variovorax paradoxus TaxID=34073 RepID=UPI0033920584